MAVLVVGMTVEVIVGDRLVVPVDFEGVLDALELVRIALVEVLTLVEAVLVDNLLDVEWPAELELFTVEGVEDVRTELLVTTDVPFDMLEVLVIMLEVPVVEALDVVLDTEADVV